MYWPLGAPRVYAASKRRRKDKPPDDEEEDEDDAKDNGSPNILGLRVARNGHLFVTITETALTVWQTAVCLIQSFLSWF